MQNPLPLSQRPHTPVINELLELRIQIIPNSPLQLRRPLAKNIRQILNIIPRRNPKPPHKIPRRTLQIVILAEIHLVVILRSAEIRIRRDRRRALESLQTRSSFGLGVGVVGVAAEEFVGGDAFLAAEFFAGVAFGVVWYINIRALYVIEM